MDNRKSSASAVAADVATVFVAIELSGKDLVALARKLVVALWRYLTAGLPPEGARFKST